MDAVERLVGDLRARQPRRMEPRERLIVWAVGLAYVVTATALAFALPWNRPIDPLVVAMLLAMFVAIDRVHFEIGSITAAAGPLVLVPMLFLLPLPLVPLASPRPASSSPRCPTTSSARSTSTAGAYSFSDAWFTIGPVLVLSLLADGKPRVGPWRVYVAAFVGPDRHRRGPARPAGAPRPRRAPAAEPDRHLLDLPRRCGAVVDRRDGRHRRDRPPVAVLTAGPLVWLLGTFARERKERYSAALELNRAYRGTVMLLWDVVEADDNYTADHCRGVVTLVNAVPTSSRSTTEARQEPSSWRCCTTWARS